MASFTVTVVILDYGFCMTQAAGMGYFCIVAAGKLRLDLYLAGILIFFADGARI